LHCTRLPTLQGMPPAARNGGNKAEQAELAESVLSFQVFSSNRTPQSALIRSPAREPPSPVPLNRPHRAANEAAPSERPTLLPKLTRKLRGNFRASPNEREGMPLAATNTKPCPPPPLRPRRIDRAEIPCPLITARTMRPPGRRPTAAIVSRYCGDACPVPLYAAPQSRLPLSSSRRPLSRRSRRTSGSSPPPPLEPKTPAYGPHNDCLRRQTLRVKRGERC